MPLGAFVDGAYAVYSNWRDTGSIVMGLFGGLRTAALSMGCLSGMLSLSGMEDYIDDSVMRMIEFSSGAANNLTMDIVTSDTKKNVQVIRKYYYLRHIL